MVLTGLVQNCSNSMTNALELLQSCTKPVNNLAADNGAGPSVGSVMTKFRADLYVNTSLVLKGLTYWGWDKMADVFQMTFSNAFSWIKMYEFLLRFHWSLFLRVQLTIFQHWLRLWLGAEQATSHNLNQLWSSLLTHICITWPQVGLELSSFHNMISFQSHGLYTSMDT